MSPTTLQDFTIAGRTSFGDTSPPVSMLKGILLGIGIVPFFELAVKNYMDAVHERFHDSMQYQWLISDVTLKNGEYVANHVISPDDIKISMALIERAAADVGVKVTFRVHRYREASLVEVVIPSESRFVLSWGEYEDLAHLLVESFE